MSTTVDDICEAGKPVTWAPIREMYKQLIDHQIAHGYGTPTSPYANLTINTYSPFYMSSTYATTMAIHFDVNGSGVITNVFLTKDSTDTTPWILPDSLAGMAGTMLYFVAEADGCWCKTMWQVVTYDGGDTFRLLELQVEDVDEKKQCCQTIPVPVEGDAIPNLFIPGNAMRSTYFIDPDSGSTAITAPKCRNLGDGITLGVAGKSIIWGARQLTGYFTWPITTSEFGSIFSAISDMLLHACGALPGYFWSASTGSPTLRPFIADVVYTMSLLGYPETSVPGCIESIPSSYKLPWLVNTCGETLTCIPAGGRVVRCDTVKSLKRIIEYLIDYLIIGDCTATVTYTHYRKDGKGCACYAYYGLPLYRKAVWDYTCTTDSYKVTVSISGPRTTDDFDSCDTVMTEDTSVGPPVLHPFGCDTPTPVLTDEVTCTEIFDKAKANATTWVNATIGTGVQNISYGSSDIESTFYSEEYSSCTFNPQESDVTYRRLDIVVSSLPVHRVIRLFWRIKNTGGGTVSSGTQMLHLGESFSKEANNANEAVEFTAYHEYE